MFIVDAHCDTLSGMLKRNEGFEDNNLQIDYKTLKNASAEGFLQFFAVFESPSNPMSVQKKEVWEMIASFHRIASDFGMKKVLCREDLYGGGIRALLALEGLYFLEGDASAVDRLYEEGVRCMSLTWGPDNEFAGGIRENSGKGLTANGIEAVGKAMEKGILIDVSHLSDRGFSQIAELAAEHGKPFVATHSNARKICGHKRNLTDDMLRKLAKSGGVAGINMFACFLGDGCIAGVDEVIKHIEHICSAVGPMHVGFGCDFDGIERDKSAIDGPLNLAEILDRLLSLNYSEGDVRNIAGGNFLRVLENVL